MRSAALLCPGPSLSKFTGHGKLYDPIIAVNRAALFTYADYWSLCDFDVFRLVKPKGRPKIWTRQDCRDRIIREWDRARDHQIDIHELYFDRYPPELRWTKYSALAALVLAHTLGATQIDCYGCDMTGTAEFDNRPLPGVNRGENRWRDEKHWWGEVVAMLQLRGMMVRIIK